MKDSILICPSYKLVRGTLDFAGVVNRATSRSRYGYVLTICVLLRRC